MRLPWLLLSLALITACGKPAIKFPEKEIIKQPKIEEQKQSEPIIAPPPAYGNKIVLNDYTRKISG